MENPGSPQREYKVHDPLTSLLLCIQIRDKCQNTTFGKTNSTNCVIEKTNLNTGNKP